MRKREKLNALITNIQGYSVHDGPGIRTVVFFKGCPLNCQWCANPEGILPKAEVGFIENLCTNCGRCLDICPTGALDLRRGAARIDYSRCKACGICVEACYYNAMVRYGKEMSVEEVFDAVRRDKVFYDGSGGGVTVSGGEPLLHAPFVASLFDFCHEAGINTCVETSGSVSRQSLQPVLSAADYILFDLKHMNPDTHKRYTGQPNQQILANVKLAVKSGANVLFRMPLIPYVNDDSVNIRETAEFIKALSPDAEIQLMPYHRLGESKYRALNRICLFQDFQMIKDESVEAVKLAFVEHGVKCTVSG